MNKEDIKRCKNALKHFAKLKEGLIEIEEDGGLNALEYSAAIHGEDYLEFKEKLFSQIKIFEEACQKAIEKHEEEQEFEKPIVNSAYDSFASAPDYALFDQNMVALLRGCSNATIERDRWAGSGVPFVRQGRSVRYRKKDIVAWLDAHESKLKET